MAGKKVSMKLNPCFVLQVQQADWIPRSGGQHGSQRGVQGSSCAVPTSITPRMQGRSKHLETDPAMGVVKPHP